MLSRMKISNVISTDLVCKHCLDKVANLPRILNSLYLKLFELKTSSWS
jgi:hypothetical protein